MVTAADANRVALAYVAETTFGEVPTGDPTLQDLRFTSESLRQDTSTVVSNEIRSDRQRNDLVRTNITAMGDLGFELSYGTYSDWLAAALLDSAWASAVTVSGVTISFAESSGGSQVISDSDEGFDSITVGSWVQISGADAANNGVFKVSAATDGSITVNNASGTLETAGDSISVKMGEQITNGTSLKTYLIEKEFTDLSNEFVRYSGMAIETLAMSITPDQLITGSFGFMGKRAVSTTATDGDGSNTAASTNEILNAVDHVTAIYEDGGVYGSTQFTMNLNNNLRNRLEIGTLGSVGIGLGTVDLTGTVQAYYSDQTEMDKYLDQTESALAIVITDDAGNVYVVDMPRVKYTTGQRVAGGINTDIIADLGYTAYRHSTENVTVRIVRFPA